MYEAAKNQPGGQQGPSQQGGPQPDQQSQSGESGKKVENADFEVVDDK
jgi:hypothetical protein